jgi:hypothetical protein
MLKGTSFSEKKFKILEDYKVPDFKKIDNMLRGNTDISTPVYVVRNYINQNECKKIQDRFYAIIKEAKGGNRKDGFVLVDQIGASQFHKGAKEFFEECITTKPSINHLINSIYDSPVIDDFMLELSMRNYFTQKKIHFGPAYNRGNYSNLFTARLWRDDKEKLFSLNAHDDLAQLEFIRNDNFEISGIENVIACNLCVENEENANLLLWNISPDKDSKQDLNIEKTGYPYPVSILEGINSISLNTSPGDLYFINANYIHAVEKKQHNKRITLGRFLGYAANDRVVYWT